MNLNTKISKKNFLGRFPTFDTKKIAIICLRRYSKQYGVDDVEIKSTDHITITDKCLGIHYNHSYDITPFEYSNWNRNSLSKIQKMLNECNLLKSDQ